MLDFTEDEQNRIDSAIRFVFSNPVDGYITDRVARSILRKIAAVRNDGSI